MLKGGLRAKSCNEDCPRVDRKWNPVMRFCPKVDREQSPVMSFSQWWIASGVLQWGLLKGRLQAKSCNKICPRVDYEWKSAMRFCPKVDCKRSPAMVFAQGWIARWLRDNCATYLTKTDPRTDGAMAVWEIAKGELQRRSCKEGRVLMTTNGNSQT